MRHPTYDEVLSSVPATADVVVPTAFEDRNGHMNIQHYLAIAADGVDECMVGLGISRDYPDARGLGMFSAEQHLTWLAEVHAGDRVTFHVRLLERTDRTGHALGHLLNHTNRTVSFVLEAVWLHVDMVARRSAPFPDDIAPQLDARIAADAALPWPPYLSGSIRLRQKDLAQ